jgi:hypothetical protein
MLTIPKTTKGCNHGCVDILKWALCRGRKKSVVSILTRVKLQGELLALNCLESDAELPRATEAYMPRNYILARCHNCYMDHAT